jgi:hypothetical protein
MSRDSDWYEELREHNPWLPPADKVLDAEWTWGPRSRRSPTLDLTVIVDLPEKPAPTWAGSLPGILASDRPALLPDALTSVALAMKSQGDAHRRHLLNAGAAVRAMAPRSEVWSAAHHPDGRDRSSLLREAAADIIQAAYWEGRDNPGLAAMWLRAADAILHGLWLGAR